MGGSKELAVLYESYGTATFAIRAPLSVLELLLIRDPRKKCLDIFFAVQLPQ